MRVVQQSSFWLSYCAVPYILATVTRGHCSLRAKDCFRQGYFPRYTAVCNLLCYPIDFSTLLIITVQDDPTQFAVDVLRNKYIKLSDTSSEEQYFLHFVHFGIQIITDSRTTQSPDIRLHTKFLHSDLSKAAMLQRNFICNISSIGIENFLGRQKYKYTSVIESGLLFFLAAAVLNVLEVEEVFGVSFFYKEAFLTCHTLEYEKNLHNQIQMLKA